ncbi:MAG: hypothetical protein M3065_09255 [Actinomycetota bacterium]|nr:hypothetical protein [Actinomycetota bacterium]
MADLREDDRTLLASSLAEAPAQLATKRLADEIERALPALSGQGAEVIDALLSLIALADEDDSIVGDLSRDVAHSEDVELPDEARDEFAEQLFDVLRLESLTLAAHAYDIVGEHERGFHDARILTDIRPVFGRVATDGAHAAVIVASLKIDFHTTGGPIESCFFALDPSDLVRLRSVVDRALEKTKSLKELISQMGLPYWEYREIEEETDAASS